MGEVVPQSAIKDMLAELDADEAEALEKFRKEQEAAQKDMLEKMQKE